MTSYHVSPAATSAVELFVSDRLMVTTPSVVTIREGSGSDITEVEVVLDRDLGRLVCSKITISRAGEGAEVTGATLREIAVQTAVKNAGDEMVAIRARDGSARILGSARDLFLPSRGRPRQDVIADAALLYLVGTLTNRPPLKEVAMKLDVSQSTATRLVAEARRQGLLDG